MHPVHEMKAGKSTGMTGVATVSISRFMFGRQLYGRNGSMRCQISCVKGRSNGISEEPTANQRTDNAEGNVQRNALAASVNDFACDKAGNEAQHQPITLITTLHLLLRNDGPRQQKCRRNRTPLVFNYVGLLIDGSPGRWPSYPSFSHPMIFISCHEPIHLRHQMAF